jgi:hypothetical protein
MCSTCKTHNPKQAAPKPAEKQEKKKEPAKKK